MSNNPVVNIVGQQDWLKPLGEKSDSLVNSALDSAGQAGDTARDLLVNSRLLGHTRHPAITDIPFGSWTVTLVADLLATIGKSETSSFSAAEISLLVGLTASLIASAGGLADLSETHPETERRLGLMHGIFHGVTTLLYGGSFLARRSRKPVLGRVLAFAGYGTLVAASYLAYEVAERRK